MPILPSFSIYKGKLPEFDALPVIAVVGTRDATAYGLKMAKNLGAQISRCGGLVISGLATGIDGMAMRGALSAGKAVVGLMGCGVDIVYPTYHKIIAAGYPAVWLSAVRIPAGNTPL